MTFRSWSPTVCNERVYDRPATLPREIVRTIMPCRYLTVSIPGESSALVVDPVKNDDRTFLQTTGNRVEYRTQGRSLANFYEDDGFIRSGSKHIVSLTDYVILLRTLLSSSPPSLALPRLNRPLSSFDRSTNIRE